MAQAKKPSLIGGASTKIQDFLTTDIMSLVLPAAAAFGALRAPKTTRGALAGLNLFTGLTEYRAKREARKKKLAQEEKLEKGMLAYAEQLATPREKTVADTFAEVRRAADAQAKKRAEGKKDVSVKIRDYVSGEATVPPTPKQLQLSQVYRGMAEGGQAKAVGESAMRVLTRVPKRTPFTTDLGATKEHGYITETGKRIVTSVQKVGPKPPGRLERARAAVYERLGTYDYKQLVSEFKAVTAAIKANEGLDIPDPQRAKELRELHGDIIRRMRGKKMQVPTTETSGATTAPPTGGDAAREWILEHSGKKWKPKEKSWFEKQLPGGTT